MRNVFLHGRLKKTFGGPYQFDVSSPLEAIRALCANFPAFKNELARGAYRIVVGSLRKGEDTPLEMLNFNRDPAKNFHIIPVASGAKNGGLGKIVLGVALIAVAGIATGGFGAGLSAPLFGGVTWGTVATLGAALTFGGIAMLLTPTPKTPDVNSREPPEQRASFLLSGPVNTAAEGQPIPIVGGRMRVGSVVISTGLNAERLP